ncbi:MAG: alkaline phosphatase family protein [Deltaproteobacteria bacterium]|nr:alkaline phosphatase family protein [Deltaproteobacteria bacterium]
MLLIFGLDGATLELVRPLADKGLLPNLQRLFGAGAWGPLQSTVPPATFPAWTTFMTGVNPGRHGIFDFTRRVSGRYAVEFVNGSFRKVPTVWNRLSAAGKRVAVLGVPGTYPPEPLNGCMISGFDTPVTVRADASFVYPPELAPLVEASGGFPFADFQEFRVDRQWYREALRGLLQGVATKARLATRILRRERWDCAMVLFGESDTVAHHFWRHCDPASPRFDESGAAEFGGAIRSVYAALDSAIGDLIEASQPDAVLVCSDHGFGGAATIAVHLNRQLEQAGLLRWRQGGVMARGAAIGKRHLLQWMPARMQARCFRLAGGRVAGAVESAARFGAIDWEHTQAFSEELNYFPSVWLNLRDRERQGTVAAGQYEQVCAAVTAVLRQLRDPDTGAAVVERVWRRDQVYEGPWVHQAPDLIIEFALKDGYSYTCLPSHGAGAPLRRMSSAEVAGGKLSGLSGSHRRDGLFALVGPVTQGVFHGATIADMTPTILALCGVAVPEGLDGRVLSCVAGRFTKAVAGGEDPPSEAEIGYDPAQERIVEDRLRALGYIE